MDEEIYRPVAAPLLYSSVCRFGEFEYGGLLCDAVDEPGLEALEYGDDSGSDDTGTSGIYSDLFSVFPVLYSEHHRYCSSGEKTGVSISCIRYVVSVDLWFLFLVCPTTNVRPADLGTGLGSDLLRLLYDMDLPVNLFPSIHCLASWMCFVAVRSSHRLPVWYKVITGIGAGLICFSTLAVKQHVIADVAAGIFLAEGLMFFSSRVYWYRKGQEIFECLSCRVFGTENIKESEKNL